MIGMKKGLFGKGQPWMTPGIGDGLPNASMPQGMGVQDGANLGTPSPMDNPRPGLGTRLFGQGWEGKAAALGASLMGNANAVPEFLQTRDMMAFRQAEEQRRRAADLADYRTQMQIKAEFERPDAPKPGSFEWYQTATPEQRALYDQYNPVIATTWQGPTPVPRSGLGGANRPAVGARVPISQLGGAPVPQQPAAQPIQGARTISQQEYARILRSMNGDQRQMNAWMTQNNVIAGN